MPEVKSPVYVLFCKQPLNIQNIQRLQRTDVHPIANYSKLFLSINQNKIFLTPLKICFSDDA